MRKLFEYCVKHRLVVELLAVLILSAGLFSLFSLRREAFPNISYDVVLIRTEYPGATPEEVEKLVTIELEDKIKEVDGIEEVQSLSTEGSSLITVKIDPDEKNKMRVVNDIQRAVDRAEDLPVEIDDPVVEELQTKNIPVISVSLSGDINEHELQKLARRLEIRLLDLSEVANVHRMGWRDREIWVEVDPELVNRDFLSLKDVLLALQNRNLNLPGGTLSTQRGEYLVRTLGEFETADEIKKVIIRANDQGNWIRVKDVAKVQDTFEDDELLERTFGEKAITLTVIKKESGDILNLVKNVRQIEKEFEKELPSGVRIRDFDDFSYYVNRRLNVLKNNGLVGIIFVFFSLLMFLNRKTALMTGFGIPLAIMASLFMMHALGMTINLITMFAIIMVLGLVVDDAIVIAENAYRHFQEGKTPAQAAIDGASEVAGPVIVTVITTLVAFASLFFMGGLMGKYLSAMPVVVIIALSASLLECLVVLPSHFAHWIRPGEESGRKNPVWFEKLRDKYTRLLHWAIFHRYKALGSFILLAIFCTGLSVTSMKFILFPQGLIEEFMINIKAPIGTSLEDTSNRVEPIEKLIANLPESELENFTTRIGAISEKGKDDPRQDRGTHMAQIHVYLTPEGTPHRRKADAIIEELKEKFKPLEAQFDEITFQKERAGPPVGKPVVVRIRGDDFKTLEAAAEEIKKKIESIPGALDVRDDFEPGKTELRVEVDEEKATQAYLNIHAIANTVRNAIDGGIATKIRKTDEEIDVLVRYPEDKRTSQAIFDTIYVPNTRGNLIPLSKISKLVEKEGFSTIRHFDRKRMVSVSAEVDEKKVTAMEIQKQLNKFIKKDFSSRYPGLLISYGGEQEETAKSIRDLRKAMLASIFFIYLILAMHLNSLLLPLMVMIAIPFGLMGIILAFFLHGWPLSFMAMLGVIGLSGVVVNDAIVLVDFIRSAREKGEERFESIIHAGRLRLRPVILTSITTIVGLLPVAYGLGGSDPFLKPMALAMGWGLLFATTLTLLLIPCLFSITDDLHKYWGTYLKEHYITYCKKIKNILLKIPFLKTGPRSNI